MDWQWFFFSFRGRLNRRPFWMFTITVSLLWIIVGLTSGSGFHDFNNNPLNIVFSVIVLWPALAVQVKRWHDINKSAWYMLIILIPIIGPIWTLVQTGFIPGTDGRNLYGSDPKDKRENTNRRVFVSGDITPYFMEIMLFIILPIGVLWIAVAAILKGNLIWLLPVLFITVFLIFFFKFSRERRVFKIITDDRGIFFYGLLREIDSPWSDILSVTVVRTSFQDMIEVKTRKEKFTFPLSMKNEAERYPKLMNSMNGWKWVFADGVEKDATVENNPLYLEIQNRMKGQSAKAIN